MALITTSSSQAERIHYLDNLRALAMMLGVFLHVGLAYAQPGRHVWLATDPEGSRFVDASIWFIHLFRMSLFFWLSGYLAKMTVQRKGLQHFIKNRLLRIVLPMVIFYPVLLVLMTLVIVFAIGYVEEPQGLLGFIVEQSEAGTEKDEFRTLDTMHLWFLYYLIWFSLISVVLAKLPTIKLPKLFSSKWILALSPLLLAPAVVAAGVPLPAPASFIPEWWPFGFYGLFYLAGWKMYGNDLLLQALQPHGLRLLAVSLVLCIPYILIQPDLDLSTVFGESNPQPVGLTVCLGVLTAYLSALLTLTSILLGKRWLNRKSGWLSFVADSSYWVYLVHLPIAIFLQTLLIPWPVSMWIKLPLAIAGTIIPCIATYVVFVRYTPLGWLLHGKRSFP
ncbi:MAG: acyltransferase family protein [Pirellulales bacterium]